jgi:hypothetical protein
MPAKMWRKYRIPNLVIREKLFTKYFLDGTEIKNIVRARPKNDREKNRYTSAAADITRKKEDRKIEN